MGIWLETIVTDAGPQLITHPFTNLDLGTLSVSVAATPIPAALPLFGTGLGLMGFVGWWRKRGLGQSSLRFPRQANLTTSCHQTPTS
jgi:hypothetical protein